MREKYQLLKLKLVHMLGFDRLTALFWNFFKVHIGFLLFSTLVTVFIGPLIYRLTGSSRMIYQYNMIWFSINALATVPGAYCVRRFGAKASIRLGIGLFIVMYVVFFIWMHRLDMVMPIIAVLVGLGNGFYFSAYHILLGDSSEEGTMDISLASIGVGTAAANMIMPMVSSLVIGALAIHSDGYLGYYFMFFLSFAVAALTMAQTAKLESRTQPKAARSVLLAFKDAISSRIWICGQAAQFVMGFRDGTFTFFLGLMLFRIIQSEMIVGLNTVIVGVLSIASYIALGKLLTPRNRVKVMLVGTGALLLFALALFIKLNLATVLLMSAAYAFFSPYIYNPGMGVFYQLVYSTPGCAESLLEYFSVRAFFFGAGRVLGVLTLILLPQTDTGNIVSILTLITSQFIAIALSRRLNRRIGSQNAIIDAQEQQE